MHRVSLTGAQPGRPERMAFAPSPDDPSFYKMAVDEEHIYAVDLDGLLRAPLTAGARFQDFWRGPGPEVKGLAVTPSHIYWSTETMGATDCAAATIYRKAKAPDAPAVVMVNYPGSCPSWELLLHGDYLYTVITSVQGGAQIVRLRR